MKVDRLAGIASSTVVAVAHVSADRVSVPTGPGQRSIATRTSASVAVRVVRARRCGPSSGRILRDHEGAAAVAARVDQAPGRDRNYVSPFHHAAGAPA
jgi:hypothetical protein